MEEEDNKYDDYLNNTFASKTLPFKRKATFAEQTGIKHDIKDPFNKTFTKNSTSLLENNTSYGDSKYDKTLNWSADVDKNDIQGSLNENRANEQSGIGQVGLSLLRATTKAATEVAKLPGVIGGMVASPFAKEGEGMDTAFNNGWIKALDGLNSNINENILPVYTSKAVKDGNLWNNISSTAFWATDGADGLGFIVAMFAPGAAFEYAGLGGKMIEGLANSKKLANIASMTEKAEEGIKAAKFLGLTGKNINSGLAVMGNTIFEAGSESKGVGDDLDRKKPKFIQNELKKGFTLEQAEESFKTQRALAMKDTFVSNVGILLGPNAIMHGMLYGKAAPVFEKTEDSVLKRIGKSALRYGEAFGSEGFWEEGSQSTVENMYVNKAINKKLGKSRLEDASIGDFAKEYVNTLTSVDGQKAIFLGGALGGPMMSYSGRKEDVENKKETNKVLDNVNNSIVNFNIIFENDVYKKQQNEDGTESYIYKKDKDGNDTHEREIIPEKALEVIKSLNMTEEKSKLFEKAISEGNTEVVEHLKQETIFDLVNKAVNNGEIGIKALEQQLKKNSQFQDIVAKDKTSDKKNNTESFIKETIETAKYLQNQSEKFQDFSKDVIQLKDKRSNVENKANFIEQLHNSYLKAKHIERQNEKQLTTLKEKRENILEELGLESNLQTEDEVLVNHEKNNVLLKNTNDKIREIEKELKNSKKDIAEIWNGGDKINKTFSDFLNNNDKIKELTSDDKVQETDNVIKDLKSLQSVEEVSKYFSNLNDELKANTFVQEVANDVVKDLNHKKLVADQQKDYHNFQEVSVIGSENTPTTSTSADKTTTIKDLTTIQSSEVAEVDNEGDVQEKSPKDAVELDKNTDPINSSKNQGAARVISTNQETGEPLFPNLKQFVEYEKKPRDKTKDKVTFDLGDINPKNLSFTANEIFKRIKKGETLTPDEIKALEEQLPIKVKFTNGNTEAYSFIDSMSHPQPDIVVRETLPLRKAIIRALIDNKGSFDGISGKIEKQFSGELKMAEQGSSVLKLDVFKDMSEDEKINYFKRNTVYVSNKGVTKHTYQDKEDSDSPLGAKHRGEVFLKIPMINGKMFYLKLNISRLSEEKANATFELLKMYSNLITDLKSADEEKRLSAESFDYKQLEDSINDPENQLHVLSPELNILKATDSTDNIDIERLINTVVFAQNTNAKTKLVIDSEGRLVLGELLAKINEKIPSDISNFTYDAQTLNNLTDLQREAIIKYLIAKRHNVLITKDDTLTFSNDDYIKYLLNPEYPILTTNAAVNEPTFQGYSNIYLNQAVDNSNKVQSKEVVSEKVTDTSVEDLLASINYSSDTPTSTPTTSKVVEPVKSEMDIKITDIEKRRQNELIKPSPFQKETNDSFILDYRKKGKAVIDSAIEANSFEYIQKLIQLASDGRSAKTIAKEISFTPNDVSVVRFYLGIPSAGGIGVGVAVTDFTEKEQQEFDNWKKYVDEINAKYDVELAALNKTELKTENNLNNEFKIKDIPQASTSEKLDLYNERELIKQELEKTKNNENSFEEVAKRNELQKRLRKLNSQLMGFKTENVVNKVVETKTNSNLSYSEIFNNSTNQEQMFEEALSESGMLTENLTDYGVNDFVKMMEMLEKVKKTNEIKKICG